MIILDVEGESFIRENLFDIAVPIHVEVMNGETKIFAYPFAKELCEEYEKNYGSDLFSDEALDFLREGCKPFCNELGYKEEKHPKNWGYNFVCDYNKPSEDIVCERVRRDGKYINLTTFNIAECLAYERVIYAVVKEGQIISVAVSSESVKDAKDIIEIGTETAVGYRNNGCSTAAVKAMSAFLCEKGLRVLYKCHHENEASAAVAKKAGFDEAGKFFYYVLRKV
ncbi:MAG: GNAT family N-acetyltransferase [Ruminococcaceae bacterium]|nr:GNAT family N-acetyltransferase [Oscillospiraceae bacterium]